jgi:PAS domain S-box-containing protein/putative nucleotidyltransferase with HDIG domain
LFDRKNGKEYPGDVMKADHKAKIQFENELTKLRSQNAVLKKSTTGRISAKLMAEEASRYAESIVGTIREPLLVLDADLKIISANRNFYRTFEVTSAETIGTFIYDLGNKQWDIPKLRELLEEVLPEKEAFDDFEVEHDFESIGHKVMLLNARQIYRKDIGTKMILLAIEDVTERKQLERLLMESEMQYRRLFETASDGIVLLEKREGKITNANPATEQLLGYAEKESLGKKLQDIGVSLDLDDFPTTMQNLNKTGIINYRNVKVKTKSGQNIDTEIYLVDRAKLVQCNIRDITERKRAQEALRESEAKYRWVVDNMADVITVMDMNLRFTYVSPSIMRMRGYTAEEATAQTFEQVMTPESLRAVTGVFEEEMRLEAGGTADPDRIRIVEVEQYRKDGSLVLMENHLSFMRDEAKKAVGIISVSHDITLRKRSEEALKKSEEEFRSLAESMPQIVWVTRKDGWNIYFNQQWVNYTGLTLEQSYGHGWNIPFHPDDRQRAWDAWLNATKNNGVYSVECRLRRADGVYHWWLIRGVPFIDKTGEIIKWFGTCTDIDHIKLAEKQLLDTLESLRKSFVAIVQVMVSAVEARDPYTAGHQRRVADLAHAIAMEMGITGEKIDAIRMAGAIHDIGKLSIPAEMLAKPAALTKLEFSLIKEHAHQGYEMLKDVESPWPLAQIVYQHHERMDGTGYPRNLQGAEILLEARILAVADVVEAMASHRPYRPSLGIDFALTEIEKNKGTLYDDVVADACLKLFREKGYKLPA